MTDDNDMVFGTDMLDGEIIEKLKKIHYKVKSRKLVNKDYTHYGHLSCMRSDIGVINFFTNIESNRRLAITGLLCAGLIKTYSWCDKFPITMYDMNQILDKFTIVDEIGWILDDTADLFVSPFHYRNAKTTITNIYIPEGIWSMINRICLVLNISITGVILYLLRMGVKGYNDFTKQSIEIDYEYLEDSEHAEKLFKTAFDIRYKNTCGKIEHVYENCKDIYLAEPRRKKSWDKIEKAVVSLRNAGFL